ncbi:unnamed protein product [Blepharisma stoltei]|uniref:Methyltransferase type 11 domain-containing protein n=1 Tax=Blepharisma stoltei TaxID=1481888 RepID=A0AAU9JI86_9CILI|nr:unnamed protein product [Blepharisma stoltei]
MPNYGDPEYWEKRYAEQEGSTFDWLEDYRSLAPIINEIAPKTAKILILGCGNAELGEDMYHDGFQNIDNIDISSVVIKQMAERNIDKPTMTWSVQDVRDIKFPSNTFDLAIDKSTIDALLCGDDAYLNVARMTKEIQRVLKTDGFYMAISYGAPESRLEHFEMEHLLWDVSNQIIGEETTNPHWVYLCKKKEGAERVCEEKWEEVENKLRDDEPQENGEEDPTDEVNDIVE